MTKHQEVFRLESQTLSQQNVDHSWDVSKNTVNRVLKRVEELGIFCPLDENDTDDVLTEKLFLHIHQMNAKLRLQPLKGASK